MNLSDDKSSFMMTSLNGNIFRVTGFCAGNSPVPGEFPAQRPVTRSFDVPWICVGLKGWINNRGAGDFRRYRVHYDVTEMIVSTQYPGWPRSGNIGDIPLNMGDICMIFRPRSTGPCFTTATWHCRENVSLWGRSLLWKLRCHCLKVLRQRQIASIRQGPGPAPRRLNEIVLRSVYIIRIQKLSHYSYHIVINWSHHFQAHRHCKYI